MYNPLNGVITIDGISMCDYNRYSLYDKSSVLFQEFMKYPLSFYENIRFKNRDKDEDILFDKACELVKLNDLIQELPEKEDQLLTKGWKDSIDLSGGQWQKVAIARFFAKDGLLRILDEPGASLDAKSESEILKNIINDKFSISIVVTHRFQNIKKYDEIIVMKDGEIESKGNHAYLMKNSAVYRDLYIAQKEMME